MNRRKCRFAAQQGNKIERDVLRFRMSRRIPAVARRCLVFAPEQPTQRGRRLRDMKSCDKELAAQLAANRSPVARVRQSIPRPPIDASAFNNCTGARLAAISRQRVQLHRQIMHHNCRCEILRIMARHEYLIKMTVSRSVMRTLPTTGERKRRILSYRKSTLHQLAGYARATKDVSHYPQLL